MEARERLARIRRIEIKTRRLVNEVFAGQYGSVFRGRGMEFAEVREYVPGDDIRSIDWNVTARMGHPFIKKFMEERELTLLLMVDASASLRFGTAPRWKSEMAAEIAAILGFSAIQHNDKVGLCLFTDRVEHFLRPQKGRTHTLRLVRDVLDYAPEHPGTSLAEALRTVNAVLKRKAIVFLLSDFYDMDEKLLATANKRHDVVAMQMLDPREEDLPAAGLLELEDRETGERRVLDLGDEAVRGDFAARAARRQDDLKTLFRRHGIDHTVLRTDRSFVQPLIRFFQDRVKRFR